MHFNIDAICVTNEIFLKDRLAEVFGETLKHIETQLLEETKIKRLEKELKTVKYKNQAQTMEHKENLLKVELEYAQETVNINKGY